MAHASYRDKQTSQKDNNTPSMVYVYYTVSRHKQIESLATYAEGYTKPGATENPSRKKHAHCICSKPTSSKRNIRTNAISPRKQKRPYPPTPRTQIFSRTIAPLLPASSTRRQVKQELRVELTLPVNEIPAIPTTPYLSQNAENISGSNRV